MARVLFAIAILLSGCGAEPDRDPHSPDHLVPPEHGFQLETEPIVLRPGEELHYCEVMTMPGGSGELYAVNNIAGAMTPYSHHLVVATVDVGSQMDALVGAGDRMECPLGVRQLGDEWRSIFVSHQSYREEPFPPRVGRFYRGGQKVILNYHYFNPTESNIRAKVALNFHTIDPASVEAEARNDSFVNFTIAIPPGETKTFFGECFFDHDVYVHNLLRHTHRWGTHFAVWWAGGERDGELAFESEHYEDTDYLLDEPARRNAGEGFRFACTFVNTEDHTLRFGNGANDEMCLLDITWWQAGREELVPAQTCYLNKIEPDGIARPGRT